MIRIVICFLFVSQFLFSNNNSVFVEFNKISFDEYKLQKMVEVELNNIFIQPEKKNFLYGTALNDLINKFSKSNHISLKIKRSKERENELKISFSNWPVIKLAKSKAELMLPPGLYLRSKIISSTEFDLYSEKIDSK